MFELADCAACGERIEWYWSDRGTRVPVDTGVDHDPAIATLYIDDGVAFIVERGTGSHVDHRDVCAVRARHPSARR